MMMKANHGVGLAMARSPMRAHNCDILVIGKVAIHSKSQSGPDRAVSAKG